jgi:protein-disulfide isomerase
MTTKAQPFTAGSSKQRNQMIIVGVVAVAVVAVLAVILLSSNSSVNLEKYDTIPQSRQADGGFVIGNPDAPVTIVEFADYACPACQSYLPVMDRLFEEYVKTGKAQFEYRVFPTAGGQMTAFTGTIATCLEDQHAGAFWVAKDLFFQQAMRGSYNQDTSRNVAQQMGLDYNSALACAADEEQVATDIALAQSVGVEATPAIRIRYNNGAPQAIPGYERGGPPFEALVAAMMVGGVS